MSRWLKSVGANVGNILDKLDDGAATAVDESTQVAQRFLAGRNDTDYDDDDDDDGNDESSYYDGSTSDDVDHEYDDEVLTSQAGDSEYEMYVEDDGQSFPPSPPTFSRRIPNTTTAYGDDDSTNWGGGTNHSSSAELFAGDDERFVVPAGNESLAEGLSMSTAGERETDKTGRREPETRKPPAKGPSMIPEEPSETTDNDKDEPVESTRSSPGANVNSVEPKERMKPPRTISTPAPPPLPPLSAPSSGSVSSTKRVKDGPSTSKKNFDSTSQKKLERTIVMLKSELERANGEIRALQDELLTAGQQMQEERQGLKEEREELLDEQEAEIQQLTSDHAMALKEQKQHYEAQIKDLRNQLRQEQQERVQEEGDYTQDLQEALEREKAALQQIQIEQTKSNGLQSQLDKLRSQHEALQDQVKSLNMTTDTARDLERKAEERLDELREQHKHQLAIRQSREAELERTVAELGEALTLAQQQQAAATSAEATSGRSHAAVAVDTGEATSEAAMNYKEKYQVAVEDLETVRTQLSMLNQRCESLQAELNDVVQERSVEVSAAQRRQHEYDEKIAELNLYVKRLEAQLREWKNDPSGTTSAGDVSPTSDGQSADGRLRQAIREAEDAKKQVATLSDQLIKQQKIVESSKAEALALKGRLQAASARADSAELALASTPSAPSSLDIEVGDGYTGSKTRRRVKGGLRAMGTGRMGRVTTRSVRSALGLTATSGSVMEQIAQTVDAADKWMIDTGTIMRHEPLARVGFAIYLIILHLWCFALVAFHTVQSEHGDLSQFTHQKDLHPGPPAAVGLN